MTFTEANRGEEIARYTCSLCALLSSRNDICTGSLDISYSTRKIKSPPAAMCLLFRKTLLLTRLFLPLLFSRTYSPTFFTIIPLFDVLILNRVSVSVGPYGPSESNLITLNSFP